MRPVLKDEKGGQSNRNAKPSATELPPSALPPASLALALPQSDNKETEPRKLFPSSADLLRRWSVLDHTHRLPPSTSPLLPQPSASSSLGQLPKLSTASSVFDHTHRITPSTSPHPPSSSSPSATFHSWNPSNVGILPILDSFQSWNASNLGTCDKLERETR